MDDTHLLELAGSVFSGVDMDLLTNYHEFSDYTSDASTLSAVAADLVISAPSVKHSVGPLLAAVVELDPEVYADLAAIVLELLIHVCTSTASAKVALHPVVGPAVESFLKIVKSTETSGSSWLDYSKPTILNQHIRLIVGLFELGCPLKLYRRLLLTAFDDSLAPSARLAVVELLAQCHKRWPCHFDFFVFNNFHNAKVALPFSSDLAPSSGRPELSVQTWMRLSAPEQDEISLFTITSSSSSSSSLTIYLVRQCQFMVKLTSANSCMQFTFNQSIDPTLLTHLVLTYDHSLNLYIDGQYSESIPCPDIKELSGWNKLVIGRNQAPGVVSHEEITVRNLMVLSKALPHEWVNFLYNLGPSYHWDFRDFSEHNLSNLLNHLAYDGLFNVALQIADIKTHKKMKKPLTSLLTSIDLSAIVKTLWKNHIKSSQIVFDIHRCQDSNLHLGLLHRPDLIHSNLYSMGGLSLVLKLVETFSQLDSQPLAESLLYTALDMLFTVLRNWRLCKEFENVNGYGILVVLLTHYRDNVNRSMVLNVVPEIHLEPVSILELVLGHTGYDFNDAYESKIVNPMTYRFLVLNYELYDDLDLQLLLNHVPALCTSRHAALNGMELTRMKMLKKLVQFLKSPAVDSLNIDMVLLSNTFRSVIASDPSVDNIRTVSLFVIYSLYHHAPQYGIVALSALTDVLCDPTCSIKVLKKFSRSITIHWILLLFNYKDETVVRCGLTLLARLLRILGAPIIKRFFLTNHGLDVLTHFLREWWHSDSIVGVIYLSAFGVDTLNAELSLVPPEPPLAMPEFLLLLNNLVLNSMYVLSMKHGKVLSAPSSPLKSSGEDRAIIDLSLNVLHLLNRYTDSIQRGFESKSLQKFYMSSEWLEGIFELVAHLRLSLTWAHSLLVAQFQKCHDELLSALANMFIFKLLKVNEIFEVLNRLSDITKTVVLELVFPRIFQHVHEFLRVLNFVFSEKEFVHGASELACYYYTEFVKADFFVSDSSLDTYTSCCLCIIEMEGSKRSRSLVELKKALGHMILLKLLRLDNDELALNDVCKDMLYAQMTVLDPAVLNTDQLSQVVLLIVGHLFQFPVEVQLEYPFSFLRTAYMMRQGEFGSVNTFLTQQSDYPNALAVVEELFTSLTTKNDDDTVRSMAKYLVFKNILQRQFHTVVNRERERLKLFVVDMIKVMLNNGGRLGYMNNIYNKSFEKDCEQLKVLIINGELVKFNRAVQDNQENIQYFILSYNSLKIEIGRLTEKQAPATFALDYIESVDRMRKRMVVEDQLLESERLSYNINIPTKQQEQIDVVTEDDGIRIDTLALSDETTLDDDVADIDDEYEVVDDAFDDKNRKVIRSLYMGDQISVLWNVSEINALVPIESLMILGSGYLYLIENYFHCADGNVIDAHDAPPELRDPYLQLINSQSSSFLKTDKKVHKTKSWGLEKLSCISKRQFLLRDIALEMFFSDGASILITCLSSSERDQIYARLSPYATGKGLDYDLAQALQLSAPAVNTPTFTSKLALAFSSTPTVHLEATKKWKAGHMSNFYYLMIINTLAGRTFNDLTQYPVFPWVIADYTSKTLDLSNPKTFRDFSKPMGGQTEPRAAQFAERYDALDSLQDPSAPPFHYGTHYSSAMIVTSFLIRMKPYVQSYLILQGGKFDHADRLFNSIEKAWVLASRDNTTDVRELTPEFFYLPEFLTNSNQFELGRLQSGETSNDVALPPWAHGDPKIFVAKNREALESPYVSSKLHLWIDLVFGYKQNGPEAVKALNVFHHLSYNGAINLDNINDEVEKRAVIGMINNFGQTPMKVFHKPHQAKEVLNIPNYYLGVLQKSPQVVFELKLKMPIEKIEKSSKTHKWVGRPACIASEDELLIRKTTSSPGSLVINSTVFLNVHLTDITAIAQVGHKLFLTGAKDGVIQVWKCALKPSLSLQFQCVLRGHISTIKTLRYSKTFKVCVSADADGLVVVWDLTRFKFIRQIKPPTPDPRVHIAISNDTGTIAVVYSTKYANTVNLYTINGDLVLSHKLRPGSVSCVAFGSINDSQVNSGHKLVINDHTYWSHDVVAVAFASPGRCIEVFEVVPNVEWMLAKTESVEVPSEVTAMELFKHTDVDGEERIARGLYKLVVGDVTGKVYTY